MTLSDLITKLENAIADTADELHVSQIKLVCDAALKAIDEAGFAIVPKELPKPYLMGSYKGEKPEPVHELRGPVHEVYATLINAASQEGESDE